jgi:hypothetical protein
MSKEQGIPDMEQQLKKAILKSGRSLNDIERESGIGSGRLSRFMRGERTLTLAAAARVWRVLKLTLASCHLGKSGKGKQKKSKPQQRQIAAGNPLLIATPQDMLAKAERDLLRLRECLNVDIVFNFFVTAYHVMDYVKVMGKVGEADIKRMRDDDDLDMCRFICTQGKHLEVKVRPKDVLTDYSPGSGMLGFGPIGGGPIGAGPQWFLFCDGKEVRPIQLAETVIAKWKKFFLDHDIT